MVTLQLQHGTVSSSMEHAALFDRLTDCHDNSVELTYIGVTLVEKITSSLTSRSLPAAVTSYCTEILRVLFQDLDLMTHLVHQFQAEDQIISHLAAKTVSTCVLYHLHERGVVSPVWEQKCVQVFHSSPPGPELDACLWSLTEVLKRLVKGSHQEILWKLVSAFDSSLSALCSRFLPGEKTEDCTSRRHWGTTVCLLLDLLEVLTASSLICGAGVCLKSQRLTHIHSSALLSSISCSSEYYVKKRVLLLLKRAVLVKAGEDWALGEPLSTGLKHEHFNSDMSMLAQSVLTAVAADWLGSVQVDSSSFFGGSRRIRGDEGQKADCVMLRGVSLLLLKSVEHHIQTAGGTAGVVSATEVFGYLQRLWGFLKKHSGQLTEVTHLCHWVSLLFGEQDDDMMEAAKALLSIFLHHRQCSGLDDSAVLEAACASGCNPHCHFLFLLRSIAFDHSILLDFLISTETCFLEYFVRYLKYLRADWQGFTAACGRISMSDCLLSTQKPLTALCGGDTFVPTHKGGPGPVEVSPSVHPTGAEMISSIAGLRLVEYGSSDESDPEGMDCQDEPGTSVCSALDVKQEISGPSIPVRQKQYESSHSTGLLRHPNSVLERRPGGPSLPEQTSCLPLSARAVFCLSELREVVTRLQTKKLFPYNPSSLLKLLVQVETYSQQSRLSHFNK
ncbi:protein Lines homolog 1 isoform X3 [Larimichthys crocea]|uniref:protein Lines homolog 1 isoform X3 n=1 Tax=Larimichthys crocea TaxID=215358 RepID=UPI000F5FA657|nr:protein Lines homolog 1 isoform X3 [Larimichthys crocea]